MKKEILIYSLGNAISRGCALLTFPMYAKTISEADFGAQDMAMSISILVGILIGLGLESGYAREYHEVEDEGKLDLITTLSLATLFLGGLCFGVLLFTGDVISELVFKSTAYVEWLYYAVFVAVVGLLKNTMMLKFRLDGKPFHFSGVSFMTAILQVVSLYYLVIHRGGGGKGVLQATALTALGSLFICVLLSGWVWRGKFVFKLLREMFAFGFPLLPAAAATFGLVYIARQSLVYTADLAEVAEFGVAYRVASMLGLLFFGFQMAWGPAIFKAMAVDSKSAGKLCGDWTRYLTLFGGLGIAGTGIFSLELIHFLADGSKYASAVWSIPLLTAGNFLWALFYIACSGVQYAKKTGYQMLATLVGASATLICVLLAGQKMTAFVGSISTFGGYLVALVLMVKYSKKYLTVDYEALRIIGFIGLSIGIGICSAQFAAMSLSLYLVKIFLMLGLGIIGIKLLLKREEWNTVVRRFLILNNWRTGFQL